MMRSMAKGLAGNKGRAALVLTMVLTVAIVAMVLVSYGVNAATGPKQVRGYARDVDGRLIQGIPVTINIRWASDDSVRATLAASSDENGYYSVTFEYSQWDIGDRIQVIATHGSNQVSNSTIADDFPFQYCNVTFPYEIPEFGSMIGFIIAGGLIAAAAMVFLVSKKKK
jgi:hypothetical protein